MSDYYRTTSEKQLKIINQKVKQCDNKYYTFISNNKYDNKIIELIEEQRNIIKVSKYIII